MNSNTSKIGYDIEFQKFIGSISHSVVFFNILSMITGNIENTERAYRHSRCSHMGKIGVCVTQGEMANYLCIKKNTVTKCMQNLISKKIIGMDYVILEMIRCPFFFVEELGKKFCDSKQENLRCLYPHILEKTGCIADAVVHGHIGYWNEHGKLPLIHSMMESSKRTGLDYRQIQFSIKKLTNLGLIIAETHIDKRYSLIALQTKVGVEKNVDGCGKECNRGWKNVQKPLEHSVEILDVLDILDTKEGGREPPPSFSRMISDEEKSKDIEESYTNIHFVMPIREYQKLQESVHPDDLKDAEFRYNQDWIRGLIKSAPMIAILDILKWQHRDRVNKDREKKEKEKLQEQETEKNNAEGKRIKEDYERNKKPMYQLYEAKKEEPMKEETPVKQDPKKISIEEITDVQKKKRDQYAKDVEEFHNQLPSASIFEQEGTQDRSKSFSGI